jgi:hypothetical protein
MVRKMDQSNVMALLQWAEEVDCAHVRRAGVSFLEKYLIDVARSTNWAAISRPTEVNGGEVHGVGIAESPGVAEPKAPADVDEMDAEGLAALSATAFSEVLASDQLQVSGWDQTLNRAYFNISGKYLDRFFLFFF